MLTPFVFSLSGVAIGAHIACSRDFNTIGEWLGDKIYQVNHD